MRRVPGYSLWLGHAGDVRDVPGLLAAGIVGRRRSGDPGSPRAVTRELVYCRFPLVDGPGNPPWLLRAAVEMVAGLIRDDVPTLVGCGAGLSRSPCIAGAAIARVRGCPADEGLAIVLESVRRPTSRRRSGPRSRGHPRAPERRRQDVDRGVSFW